jgi:outer membrane immunogenic protein
MKKMVSVLALAGASLGISAAAALAADLPVKAPMMVPAQSFDWSGWYAGAGIGGSWNDLGWTYVSNGANPAPNPIRSDQAVVAFHGGEQYQLTSLGGLGGLVIGYEYSLSMPLETNWGNSSCPNPAFRCEARLQNLQTVGAKLGLTWDRFMLYGTGGWAAGSVLSVEDDGAVREQTQRWHNGWFVGGGLDYAFYHTPGTDWILGVDYKHVELDGRLHLSTRFPGIDDRTVDVSSDQLLARLTVKLNGPPSLLGSLFR